MNKELLNQDPIKYLQKTSALNFDNIGATVTNTLKELAIKVTLKDFKILKLMLEFNLIKL